MAKGSLSEVTEVPEITLPHRGMVHFPYKSRIKMALYNSRTDLAATTPCAT